MYLVDTSVWIDYIQGNDVEHVAFLDELLLNPLATGITDVIFLEILQGAKNQKSFEKLQSYFISQTFYRFAEPQIDHAEAARIYFDCRRNGITIRSTIDCLIARCALVHNLILLHHDKDFIKMATVIPDLKQKHFML